MTVKKLNFSDLCDNPNWKKAVIVYKSSNWKKEYSEKERSYEICNGQWGLDSSKIGRCLIGNCLDGKDLNVRLDSYKWAIDYCYITEEVDIEETR